MTASHKITIDTPDGATEPDGMAPTPENQATETPQSQQAGQAVGDADVAEQLSQAREQASQNYDKMLRLAAELDNAKKRAVRDLEDVRKFANEMVFKDLLDVWDNLRRALDAAKADDCTVDGLSQGVALTLAQLEKVFDRFNVKPVTAVGEPFDPRVHQAMMQEPTDRHPVNTVVKELQQGFTIHDRLLRPAMVVVAAAPAP